MGGLAHAGGMRHGAAGRRTLAVLVCVSLAVIALYQAEGTTGPVHTLRAAVQVVKTPFTWMGAQVARPFDVAARIVSNASADDATLAELVSSNEELTAQVAALEEYRLENASLRSLLDMANAYGTQGMGARVIGLSSDEWTDTVTIDKGADDGVAVGMPVTDGAGLVGQVTAVASSSSTVTLVSDSTSQVSALLQGSRSTGVLCGSVDGSLHLEYVATTAQVSVGELVVTSGLGGVYPKGLLIGTVASVTSSPSDVYYSIVVTPAARTGNYETVYVVTSYDAEQASSTAESLLVNGMFVAQDGSGDVGTDTADSGDAPSDEADQTAGE